MNESNIKIIGDVKLYNTAKAFDRIVVLNETLRLLQNECPNDSVEGLKAEVIASIQKCLRPAE